MTTTKPRTIVGKLLTANTYHPEGCLRNVARPADWFELPAAVCRDRRHRASASWRMLGGLLIHQPYLAPLRLSACCKLLPGFPVQKGQSVRHNSWRQHSAQPRRVGVIRGYQRWAASSPVTCGHDCGLLSPEAVFRSADRGAAVADGRSQHASRHVSSCHARSRPPGAGAGVRGKHERPEPTWLAAWRELKPQRRALSQAQAQIRGAGPAPSRRRPGPARQGRLSDPLPRASSRAATAASSRIRVGPASLREPRPRHTARPGTTWPGPGTSGATPHEPGPANAGPQQLRGIPAQPRRRKTTAQHG